MQQSHPTRERPARKRRLMRVCRGYLMIAGGAVTLYGLARLVTGILIFIRSTMN